MLNRNHHERSLDLATALDRQWDAILSGSSEDPELERRDPALAAATRRIHALDKQTPPHPAFVSKLWEDLMDTQSAPSEIMRGPDLALGAYSPPLVQWRPTTTPRPVSRLAAAILLIVLLAGSAFAALYPLRQQKHAQLPIFAPMATPTLEPGPEAEKRLLDLNLSDFPAMRAQGGIDVTEYPPGGRSQERTLSSTDLLYIAAGPLHVTASKAPKAIQVMQTDPTGRVASSMFLIEGQDASLEAGTALLLAPETVLDVANEGTSPARLLDVLSSTASTSSESGGAMWRWGSIGNEHDLSPPISLELTQTALAAGASIPAPAAASTSLSAATLDAEQTRDIRFEADRGWHNGSASPVEIYVLRVTSAANDATPTVGDAQVAPAGQLEFLWQSMGDPETPLSEPYGVGVDAAGYIWVADQFDRFTIIAPDGSFVETWGTSGSGEGEFEFMCACGSVSRGYGDIAFDADGNIYVADTGNHRVQKFAPDRSFLFAWGSEGWEDGQFINASGIAIDSNGTVYVSDEVRGDIQMFDPEGVFLGTIGEPGITEGKFMLPAGVGIGPTGDVWIADYGPDRIQRFSSEGAFLDAWGTYGTDDGELNNPNDVAIDAQGRVFVADDGNSRLQVFTADGHLLARVGGFGAEPGMFNDALGVAVGPDGTVYVSGRNGLQAFRPVS